MSCGVGQRCGSDQGLLWHRSAAIVPIQPLDWEPPHAAGVALKRQQNKKKKKKKIQVGTGVTEHNTQDV